MNSRVLAMSSHRLVHLDLKGAPPKVPYLLELFPLLSRFGATGLLVEYEDVFPFTGQLKQLAQPNAYTPEDVAVILNAAAGHNLIIVPLLQTFGHFEFVLKHECFSHLREVARYPDALCPSNPATLPLVRLMLVQYIDLHPGIKYIHIGADEVWHLGVCTTCTEKMRANNWTQQHLYLQHVRSVLDILREIAPQVQPIMWDDMMRQTSLELLQESEIGHLVEPMVWHYEPETVFSLPAGLWDKYDKVFRRFWVASCFKGATGSCQCLPVPRHHVSNQEAWLKTLSKEAGKFDTFSGIALTGWSRYDHYAVLCELLPASIPSLCLCLETLTEGSFTKDVHESTSNKLGFSQPIDLDPFPRTNNLHHPGDFPGSKILYGMQLYANLRDSCYAMMNSDRLETWLNSWQVETTRINPMHLDTMLPPLVELYEHFCFLEEFIKYHLPAIFHPETVTEWLGTHVRHRTEKLRSTIEQIRSQLQLLNSRAEDSHINSIRPM